MSIPADDRGCPIYKDVTHFPHRIYEAETVLPLPYFRRDIIDQDKHFEWTRNYNSRKPHSQIPSRWGWGYFINGYGYGNFNTHYNCPSECDPDPKGYVSQKTMNLIKAYKNSPYYR